jgi:hypothetical protein
MPAGNAWSLPCLPYAEAGQAASAAYFEIAFADDVDVRQADGVPRAMARSGT